MNTFSELSLSPVLKNNLAKNGFVKPTAVQSQAIPSALAGHVVIATPGRLCDYLKRNLVNLSAVRVLVLDEADRMLDMGFLPSIQAIVKAMPSARQTLCFSATAEASVTRVIEAHVKNPVRVSIGST